MLCSSRTSLETLIVTPSRGRGLMTEVLLRLILVGFQARFQTAGNLIFKPEEQSTLHVSCNSYFIQKKSGSIRITMLMIKLEEIMRRAGVISSMMPDLTSVWKEIKIGGSMRRLLTRRPSKSGPIIRRFSYTTKEIAMGTRLLI